MNQGPIPPWRETVLTFRDQLEKYAGRWSVKDLCDRVLDCCWKSEDEILDYLNDFRKVSLAHYALHRRWSSMPNSARMAVYDAIEIELVSKLIADLNGPAIFES